MLSHHVNQLQTGKRTVEEATVETLHTIRQNDLDIHAFVCIDDSLEEARRLDALSLAAKARLPLLGVCVAIKDIFSTEKLPTRYGTERNIVSAGSDSAMVNHLRSLGALIIGKTVTTEYAASFKGKSTVNPLAHDRTPGGSSSGSAAAVASTQALVSVGTQTAGSIVRPAAYCGIFGFKPTHGVISLLGAKVFCPSLDTIGFFARCVEDLELLVTALHLKQLIPSRQKAVDISSLRLGWCKTHAWPKASVEAQQVLLSAVARLSCATVMQEVAFPDDFNQLPQHFQDIVSTELDTGLTSELAGSGLVQLDAQVASYDASRGVEAYLHAVDSLAVLRKQFDEIADDYDAIISLSIPDEAPLGLERTGDASFNIQWTVLHVPTINIPYGKGRSGMPLGLTLVARRFQDLALIEAAKVVAQSLA